MAIAARNTIGKLPPQVWALTPQNNPDPNGNIWQLWVGTGGTVVVYFADGSGPFTFTLAAGQWYAFPYAIQQVGTASTASGILAAGWGSAPNA